MQSGMVWIDGELVAAAQARVSVFDRGFLYGDSAFEVMRTYGGRPFREQDHLQRLRASCERVCLPLPRSLAELSVVIAQATRSSRLPECYVRVMITRGVAPLGLDLADAKQPSALVFALPLRVPPESTYTQGIAVGLLRVGRATDGTRAVGAKTSNYLGSVLALHEVKQRGAAEAIVIGAHGELIEGATSNVFIVRDRRLLTPPIEAGILAGITRKTVLELAASLGIDAREQELSSQDLYAADEVFITSTVRELVPVVRADDRVIGQGRPGPIAARLLAAYRALAGGPVAAR